MSIFVKCGMCGLEIPKGEAKKCVFATHKRVIGGKEYVFFQGEEMITLQ